VKTVQNCATIKLPLFSGLLCWQLLFCQLSLAQVHSDSLIQQIKSIRQTIQQCPLDVTKRLHLASLLRRNGEVKQAAIEDLNATAVDPSCCIAYHEMLQNKATVEQVEECIARLTKYDQLKPDQLAIRMTLSELYENKGDYYQAARVLVDLQYVKGAIPSKFAEPIDSRIHALLNDSKDAQTTEKAIEHKENTAQAESTPVTPVPMPDVNNNKDVPASKLRNTRMTEGYGHSQLLP
jgi:hypothetical protein